MANQLFQNFPKLQYKLSNGKIVTIRDFFRKARIEQATIPSLTNYTYYEILEGERPDVVLQSYTETVTYTGHYS